MIISDLSQIKAIKCGETSVDEVFVGESKVFPEETNSYFYIFHQINNVVTKHVLSLGQTSNSFVDLVAQGTTYCGYKRTVLNYSDVEGKSGAEILELFGTISAAQTQNVESNLEQDKVYMVFEQDAVYINSLVVVDDGNSQLRLCGVTKNITFKNYIMNVNQTDVNCSATTKVNGKTALDIFELDGRIVVNSSTIINNNTTYNVIIKFTTRDNIIVSGSQKTVTVDANGNITIN